jgi:carboxylesterase
VLKYLLPSLKGIASDIADPDAVEKGYARTPLKAADSLRRAWPVVREDLGSITMPVLLLRSRLDHVVEPENSRVLLETISSTDVTEIVLEHSYHVATLDYDKQIIFDSSVEFIRRITGQAGDTGALRHPGAPGVPGALGDTAVGGPGSEAAPQDAPQYKEPTDAL